MPTGGCEPRTQGEAGSIGNSPAPLRRRTCIPTCETTMAAPVGCRHLVEVGGIEPPSRETSASASPSAANSELSEHEDSVGKHPHALSGIVFPCRSRNPGRGIPHCNALHRRGGCPPGGQERLSTLPVRNFRLHLCVYRLFNEDSGDLCSLPAPQPSRSKPCHPRSAGTAVKHVHVTRVPLRTPTSHGFDRTRALPLHGGLPSTVGWWRATLPSPPWTRPTWTRATNPPPTQPTMPLPR